LTGDIQLIADSLTENSGEKAGLFAVRRLLRRIDTFGFSHGHTRYPAGFGRASKRRWRVPG